MANHRTRQLTKRRIEIIKELSELSRSGWRYAKYDDYIPLERELDNINRQLGR